MSIGPKEFDVVRELVRRTCGVVIDEDKSYLVDVRLGPLLRELGLTHPEQLVELIASDGSARVRRRTVEVMANCETHFYRDFAAFEMLRTVVLPAAIARRADARRLRIWSAACSTGQEPYSIAMLLAEHFPQLADWDVSIVGSDFSLDNIERARAGTYTQFEVNRGLPARMLVKFLSQEDDRWTVVGSLRERVTFVRHNLLHEAPPVQQPDLVLLRNVMIYWDLDTRREVLRRVLADATRDTALVLGAAESQLQLEDLIERVACDGATYFRPMAIR